jgi:ketosteroid isomerase-like protein
MSMDDEPIRKLIADHFANAGRDEAATSTIYADDAVLEFPQGRERIRGRVNIEAFRAAYPAALDITISRMIGHGELWINQVVIRYDGKPSYSVSIMEFSGDKVVRETIYVTDSWDPPAWRAQWVESMDEVAGQ